MVYLFFSKLFFNTILYNVFNHCFTDGLFSLVDVAELQAAVVGLEGLKQTRAAIVRLLCDVLVTDQQSSGRPVRTLVSDQRHKVIQSQDQLLGQRQDLILMGKQNNNN